MAKARKKRNGRRYVFDTLTIAAAILFALGMTLAQVEASHLAPVHGAEHQAVMQINWESEIESGCIAVASQANRTLARTRFFLRSLQ